MPRGALTRERDVGKAYAAHSRELYGFAARSLGDAGLAEEAVQETFVRAWRARDQFDPEIDTVRTWLFSIMRDLVIELERARAARPPADDGIEQAVEPLEQSLLAWHVEEAMRRISTPYRQILVETYYRGRPYAEIAAELGISEATVRSRVYGGMRALREALEKVRFES
jgi:RNA polymerase sigma-70 factor (ECF subfamily)